MIWSIRIVARYAMGREAMGFGDVTLMAMIGAFLGWQASLLTFAIAPFAALLIVAVCFILRKTTNLLSVPICVLAAWYCCLAGQPFGHGWRFNSFLPGLGCF